MGGYEKKKAANTCRIDSRRDRYCVRANWDPSECGSECGIANRCLYHSRISLCSVFKPIAAIIFCCYGVNYGKLSYVLYVYCFPDS
jgi:hypothetical protein